MNTWVMPSAGDVSGSVNVTPLREKLTLLLHLLHPLEHPEWVDVACDCHSLVELVAVDVLHPLHLFQLLLHLLLALITAHGHSELDHRERSMVLPVCVVAAGVDTTVHRVFFATGKHLQHQNPG
jgi:hypothetical protein